jgi:hypothetical protein
MELQVNQGKDKYYEWDFTSTAYSLTFPHPKLHSIFSSTPIIGREKQNAYRGANASENWWEWGKTRRGETAIRQAKGKECRSFFH